MRRPRRNHTATLKAKVAVAALRGDKTLIQLTQQFDVHAYQITQWKTQLLDRAKDSFETAAERSEKAESSDLPVFFVPVITGIRLGGG